MVIKGHFIPDLKHKSTFGQRPISITVPPPATIHHWTFKHDLDLVESFVFYLFIGISMLLWQDRAYRQKCNSDPLPFVWHPYLSAFVDLTLVPKPFIRNGYKFYGWLWFSPHRIKFRIYTFTISVKLLTTVLSLDWLADLVCRRQNNPKK